PVPDTSSRLMLFSRASRRTSGDERTSRSSSAGNSMTSLAARGCGADVGPVFAAAPSVAAAPPLLAPVDLAGSGFAASLFAGAALWAAGAAEAPAPSASITPTTVFTWTVLPSPTLISRSTPDAGAGISASTLSVEISKSGSSRCTLSPGFLSHLVMVPSKIDSPIWGMITSVAIRTFRAAPVKSGRVRPTGHYIYEVFQGPLASTPTPYPLRRLKNCTWRSRFTASARVLYGPPRRRRGVDLEYRT